MPRRRPNRDAIMSKKPATPVMSAAMLQEKWKAEQAGLPWPPPHVVEESLTRARAAEAAAAESQAQAQESRQKEQAALAKAEEATEKKKYGVHEVRKRLDEILRKNGIDPAEQLVELALERWPADYINPELRGQLVCDVDQRIKIWSELLSYQMPKLKSMEVAGQVDHSLTVVVRKFTDEAIPGIGKVIQLEAGNG